MKNKDAYIFIDTCSLLDSCWDIKDNNSKPNKAKEQSFWNSEFKALSSMGLIILPRRNYEELKKHSESLSNQDLAKRAAYILDIVNSHIKNGLIEIVGDANDPFADAILLSVALKFRTQRNLAFVTQDQKLARDLNAVAHFESVRPRKGYQLKVRRIGKNGTLERFWWDQPKNPSAIKNSSDNNGDKPQKKHRSNKAPTTDAPVNWWEA